MAKSMIERIATRLAMDMADQWHRADEFSLDDVNADTYERAISLACLILEELRVPTKAMIDATNIEANEAEVVWRSMLNGALQEPRGW